ncbi:transcription antitermination factor NusB [Winogradskyella sp. DF17]|uniref:Transcription antitermination factor NusB n=2 Tax=Winogradskyella pelagia TaxID=2819984 RepID=A0ABS3T1H1_9FLAO|nr:transcription antitermination factor NusB [Winogradskyella sp. DF17]
MLTRRHIRIKVMQSLYAYRGTESDNFSKDEKFLLHSLDSMYDLYLSIFALLTELHKKSVDYNKKIQQTLSNIEEGRNMPSMIESNKVLKIIVSNAKLQEIIKKRKLNFWDLDFEYVDILFKLINNSSITQAYAKTGKTSFEADKNLIINIYSEVIAPNDKLYEYFEDKKLTWVDDLPIVNTAIVKLFRKLKESNPDTFLLPELYKDEEDRTFATTLLKKTLLNASKFGGEIALKTKNWDADRLASVDGVLLKMALCEFQKFPSIPYKVTINEYLEIAKEYSTPKSSIFINGILDRIIKEYKEEGLHPKAGRGLL